MKSIIFIYGTTSGNTEMTVEFIADLLNKKGFKSTCIRAEKADLKDLSKCDILVLVSPTYGHGLLEGHMVKFVKKLKEADLKGKPCAVIGLGDPKYEAQYHIESATTLENVLTKIGGKILLPALRISMTPVMHLKGLIPFWTDKFVDTLK